MQEQDVTAADRLRRLDSARRNTAERACDGFDAGRWARHPSLIALHAPAPHLDADAGAGTVLDEKPRAEPHQLGPKTRALRFRQCQLFIASSERTRDLTRSAGRFQRIVLANTRMVSNQRLISRLQLVSLAG